MGKSVTYPLVSQEFDNVPRDEASAADTCEQEEIPDGDSGASFMDKV